ncbi:glutamyl-tRNA reductase [Microbacteriaceae bacterium 4G12]
MLVCLTASHRNAPFELLEKLSTGASTVAETLVRDKDAVTGAVVLATCNRFEAYLDVDEPRVGDRSAGVDAVLEVVSQSSGIPASELRDRVAVLGGDDVVEHLFAVSSGLESVVVGEGEIAGQVRRALEKARAEGTTSSDLERLFQTASHTSRGVKTRTGLGSAGRSMVRLALDLAESRLADWADLKVLLVGTGAYAGASLKALRDRGVGDVTVYSPSGRAHRFATREGVEAVMSDGYLAAIAESDLIVTCSTSSDYVLTAEQIADSRHLRADATSRQMVIDLGLPRNVDPAITGTRGVQLLDLETISLHAPLTELNAADDARQIVDAAAEEFRAANAEEAVKPAVVALRSHLFGILDAEIERARSRGDSSDRTEAALRHLVGVLVHSPSVRARELARSGDGDRFVDAVNTLFGLDAPSVADAPAAPVRRIDEEGAAS